MPLSGWLFLGSLFVFVISAFLVSAEERRGQRLFLPRIRAYFDQGCLAVVRFVRHTVSNSLRLSWYYGLHSALRALLSVIVRTYDSLERVFTENRKRARALRLAQKEGPPTHLSAIEDHKRATALSTSEKKRLRAKHLKGE